MTDNALANQSENSPVLVLDLDGTLVDTAADLTAALNVAIGTVGLAPLPVEVVGKTAGKGGRAMIALAHDLYGHKLNDQIIDDLIPAFLSHYEENISVHSTPYPGAVSAIEEFRSRGWKIAICTNKLERYARLLLDELDLSPVFSAICGSDTFEFRKPDGRHILETIALCDGHPASSIMVGDTATDIDAAKDAKVLSVAVEFEPDDEPASALGANRVISHFDQLWPVVEKLRLEAHKTDI